MSKDTREKTKEFNASVARDMASHANLNGKVTLLVIAVVLERIKRAAAEGKMELLYPFDGITQNGEVCGASEVFAYGHGGLREEVREAVISDMRRRLFKYNYRPTQDPGHPCDRPYESFSW